MQGPMHIAHQNEYGTANYRLRNEPLPLISTYWGSVEAPGSDRWDDDGGACAPPPVVTEIKWANLTRVKPGLPRKQRAAHQVVKWATITLVKINKSVIQGPNEFLASTAEEDK